MVFVYARGLKEARERAPFCRRKVRIGARAKANTESGERRRARKAVRSIVKTSRRRFDFPLFIEMHGRFSEAFEAASRSGRESELTHP